MNGKSGTNKGKHMNNGMNGAEIAKELGISRQAVSFALRKSVNKLYYEVQRLGYADDPFDTVLTLALMLGINKGSSEDMKEFISLLNNDVQVSLKRDAAQIFNV